MLFRSARLSGCEVTFERKPTFKMVDTCAGEFAAHTPYSVSYTHLTGYLETLTDRSYWGQMVVQTFPPVSYTHLDVYKRQVEKVVINGDSMENVEAELAYFGFLGNVGVHLAQLEENGTPCVFELYPGGRFARKSPESDLSLIHI